MNELIKTFVRMPEGKIHMGELDIDGTIMLRNVDIGCECVS
jgi:hypothetical protein